MLLRGISFFIASSSAFILPVFLILFSSNDHRFIDFHVHISTNGDDDDVEGIKAKEHCMEKW
mgnify:CR=1 FL=1